MMIKGASTILRVNSAMLMVNGATNLALNSDAVRRSLEQEDYGRKFLELWPTISTTVDVATITTFIYAARQSIIKAGQNLSTIERINIEAQIGNAEAKLAQDGLSSLFAGARQRAISRFGDEAERLIYFKFSKDGGAAAEIIDYFGKEGIDALKKVNSIQEAASELVKGKTVYRYLNEGAYGFSEIKSTGIIKETPKQYPTYCTTERYASGRIAKDKLQLPGENDPTWVIEFNPSQIINDIQFPLAKWNQAEYFEVMCRSYTANGAGGGLQFITNSRIKVTKMMNLVTGEVITF